MQAKSRVGVFGALAEPKAWQTIRPTDAQNGAGSAPVISDRPYVAMPDQIGAFFIVEADSVAEAVQIAAKHPSAHIGRFQGGGIEVCPCEAFADGEP